MKKLIVLMIVLISLTGCERQQWDIDDSPKKGKNETRYDVTMYLNTGVIITQY